MLRDLSQDNTHQQFKPVQHQQFKPVQHQQLKPIQEGNPSREAALEYSPRRKPWVGKTETAQAPEGRKTNSTKFYECWKDR